MDISYIFEIRSDNIFQIAKQNFKLPVTGCDFFRADQISKQPVRRTFNFF